MSTGTSLSRRPAIAFCTLKLFLMKWIYLFHDSAKTSTGASLRTKRPTIVFLILKLFPMNWTFSDNTTTMKHLGSIAILCWVVSVYLQCFVQRKSQMIFYEWYTDNCTLYFVSFNYALSSCFCRLSSFLGLTYVTLFKRPAQEDGQICMARRSTIQWVPLYLNLFYTVTNIIFLYFLCLIT